MRRVVAGRSHCNCPDGLDLRTGAPAGRRSRRCSSASEPARALLGECQRPQQLHDECPAVVAQCAVQVLLDSLRGDPRPGEQVASVVGDDDDVGAPIGRIGLAPHQAARLQVVDQGDDLARVEPKELGQFALRGAGVARGQRAAPNTTAPSGRARRGSALPAASASALARARRKLRSSASAESARRGSALQALRSRAPRVA